MRGPRWLGLVALAMWALYLCYKARLGIAGEMLWACHIATLGIGFGALLRRYAPVAMGFLFHAGVGVLTNVLDVIANQALPPMTAASHVVPVVVGYLAVRGTVWPRWIPLATLGLCAAVLPVTYLTTDPALNINVAHTPWPPLAPWFSSVWTLWLFNVAVGAVLLFGFDALWRRWPRPARSG